MTSLRKKSLPVWILLMFLWGNAWGQDDPGRFFRWFTEDPVSIVSNMGPSQLVTVGSIGASLTVFLVEDRSTSYLISENYHHSGILNFADKWGDKTIALPVSAGLFATSLFTQDRKFQDAAFTSLQSVLLANLTVNAGKFLFARSRPGSNDSPYDFDFVSFGETSFPSGHTATAFALITPWVVYYPNLLTYSLLAIPTATAVARVAKQRHWPSDVLAGAAIGFSLGYGLSKMHIQTRTKNVEVVPTVGREMFALSFKINL